MFSLNGIRKYSKNKLFLTGFNYSIASTCNTLASMVMGILIIRWLNPHDLGVWNLISMFQAYFPFLQLGIQNGLNRDLPVLLGAGKQEESKQLVATAKGYAFLIVLFFLFMAFLVPIILLFRGENKEMVWGVATICIIGASMSLSIHLIATYRSSKAFDKLTNIYFIQTILIFFLGFFIYKYHYYGILIYNAINFSVIALLMYHWAPFKNECAKFDKKSFKKLLSGGLVLMSFIQLRSAAQTIPKWIILRFANIATLGLFTPALAINGIITMLPTQIAQFIHPQMGFKYGETKKASSAWPYIKKLTFFLPLFSLPIVIAIWVAAPYLLENFFPKYTESLSAMRIMGIGFIFSSSFTTHGILYTIRAYKPAYLYLFMETLGYFLFPYLFIKIGSSSILTAIAMGITINNITLYIINIVLLRITLFLPKYNEE